jgi:xanthine dehydrogenase YagS FAD-binding subunit
MKERIEAPNAVLSIDRLNELRYIRQEADGIHIGCLTTLADIGRSKLLATKYTAFHHAAAHAATPQIRERATLGGNLCQRPHCWYFRNREFHCLKKGGATCFSVEGENRYHAIFGGGPCHIVHPSNVAPAVVALDGVIVVQAAEGAPQRIKADRFFVLPDQSLYAENVLKPGQMITEVVLPAEPTQSASIELREKQSFDWPIAIASVARVNRAWRVCLGAVAPIPWLSKPAMDVLGERDVTREMAHAAGEAASQDAEPMSGNAYKVQLTKTAVRRALLAAASLEAPS